MHGARLSCDHAASTMQSLMPLDLERAVKMVPRNLDASSVRNIYTRLHTFLFILPRTQVVWCFDHDIRVGIIKQENRENPSPTRSRTLWCT